MGDVDPWEAACSPAMAASVRWTPEVIQASGPERIYDQDAADSKWKPRRVGFVAPTLDREPMLWDGDDS